MLSDLEFHEWCENNNISEEARKEIVIIRTSPPARRVKSTTKNVCGFYSSKKMGVTIQFESHRGELAVIYELEHNPDVLEYYDQPPSIKLLHTKDGRTMGYLYTSDFFVIWKDRAGWIEFKTEKELLELGASAPHRYVRDEEGVWHLLPGEQYAKKLGLTFMVYPSNYINPVFQRNLVFLDDYYRLEGYRVSDKAIKAIQSLVTDSPGITLDKLLTCSDKVTADDIYMMIVKEEVFVDLKAFPLAEPENVHVYRNEEIAHAYSRASSATGSTLSELKSVEIDIGTQIMWDGKHWKIINTGETNTYLLAIDRDETIVTLGNETFVEMIHRGKITVVTDGSQVDNDNPALEILKKASPENHEEATERLRLVTAYLNGALPKDCPVTLRTVQRWSADYRKAKELYGDGYVGLIPKTYDMGFEGRRLDQEVLDEINNFIENEYETYKQIGELEAYGKLLLRLKEKGLNEVSYKTFSKEVKSRPRYEQIKNRKGERAANDHEFFWHLDQQTPRHGDRPFEICHLDHTEGDIELVTSEGINLGRPWLTFLMDAFTRLLIAFFVSFDPPSYRSCMAALRLCVQKFSRFPQVIVVDGGPDFKSTYFDSLIARCEGTKKIRPKTKARYGGVLERLFGTTNTQFIYTLDGNTQIMKEVRHVTKANNPKKLAVWQLPDFIEALSKYFKKYNSREHPALNQSPIEAFRSGIARTGTRPNRIIIYDEAFRIFSLPSTPKGTARVIPRLGVKINNIYYWSDIFRRPKLEGTDVPIRYDPFDIGTAYVYIDNEWVKCISEYYYKFKNMTEKELKLRSEIYRKKLRTSAASFRIRAKDLAELQAENDEKGKLLKQQRKDQEQRKSAEFQAIGASQPDDESAKDTEVTDRNQDDAMDIDPTKFKSFGEY